MNMLLSIIIVSSNCQTDLLNCLASIYQFPPQGDFEIIVVDNASSDKTTSTLRVEFPQVLLIVNEKNVGFAPANNQGAKSAKGDYLFFLNPDTIINDSDEFDTMIRIIEESQMSKLKSQNQISHSEGIARSANFKSKEKEIAIVGPRLIDKDGSFQWSCGPIPSVFNMILDKPLALVFRWFGRKLRILKLLSLFSQRYYQGQKPLEVGFVSGAAIMIKKSVFDELDGFGEKFFLYFEDVDLCLRAKKLGYKVIYLPTVQITHLSGQSQKERLKQKEEWYYQSQRYFFAKHKGRWEQVLVRLLSIPYRVSGIRSKLNKYY